MHVICGLPLGGLLSVSFMFGGVMSAFHMEQENHSGNAQITCNNTKFIHLQLHCCKGLNIVRNVCILYIKMQ